VVEFVLAGASAVAVGTATFANPFATVELVEALPAWLAARGHRRLGDLRAAAHR
jgi:dihydroorotate dehydrogenase (NAD+) catalytic subunit